MFITEIVIFIIVGLLVFAGLGAFVGLFVKEK